MVEVPPRISSDFGQLKTGLKNQNFIHKTLKFRKEPRSQVNDSAHSSATACLPEATNSQLVKPAFLDATGHVEKQSDYRPS